MKKEKLILYGTLSIVKTIIEESFKRDDLEVVAIAVDDDFYDEQFDFMGFGLTRINDVAKGFDNKECNFIVMSSNNVDSSNLNRMKNQVEKLGFGFANFISKHANISQTSIMGLNNVVCANVFLGPEGKLGSNNLIREFTYIGHNYSIGDNNTFSPGVKIAGNSCISDNCYFGINCTLIEKIKVDESAFVGAGSVVIKNIESNTLNVGNPSRIVRKNHE